MRILSLGSLLLVLLMTSCYSEEYEVRAAYFRIMKHIENQRFEELAEAVDSSTHYYLRQLTDAARNNNQEAARWIGKMNDCPLTSLYLYYEMHENLDTTTNFQPDDLMFLMVLSGVGILKYNQQQRYTFKDVKIIDDQLSRARIWIKANEKASIESHYVFRRTASDREWKLNLTSTFGVEEKLLRQLYRKSGKSENEFIEEYAANKHKEIQFRYKAWMQRTESSN